MQRHPDHGEEHEGRGEYEQMQAPVRDAGDHRLAGETRALQKEEHTNRNIGGHVDSLGHGARGGQKGGQRHHENEGDEERIGDQPAQHVGPHSCGDLWLDCRRPVFLREAFPDCKGTWQAQAGF